MHFLGGEGKNHYQSPKSTEHFPTSPASTEGPQAPIFSDLSAADTRLQAGSGRQ